MQFISINTCFFKSHTYIWFKDICVCVCVCVKICRSMCAQSCLTLCNPMDCSIPPGFFVCGIFQAKTLGWVSISSSGGSSWPRVWTRISCIGRQILYLCATWEIHIFLVQSELFPVFYNVSFQPISTYLHTLFFPSLEHLYFLTCSSFNCTHQSVLSWCIFRKLPLIFILFWDTYFQCFPATLYTNILSHFTEIYLWSQWDIKWPEAKGIDLVTTLFIVSTAMLGK